MNSLAPDPVNPISDLRKSPEWKRALRVMKRPLWPLFRLIHLLYLAGGYRELDELLSELPETVDTGDIIYEMPARLVHEHLDLLKRFVNPTRPGLPRVMGPNGLLDPVEAGMYLAQQALVTRELEVINGLLCRPIGCHLCCIGPEEEDKNLFFEIPLEERECDLFEVPRYCNQDSMSRTPYDDSPLLVGKRPFYQLGPAIYRWKTGFSLILPRNASCPNLLQGVGCSIYKLRPDTCKRPQIFAYVIQKDGAGVLHLEGKLLGITDCPYVLELKKEIHLYASLNGLDLVLSPNRL